MANLQNAQRSIEPKWLAMLGVGMGIFTATLDLSIVNISLPTLVEDLNTSFSVIEWVILSYVLVVTSLMLGMARLGDMRDKKKIYMTGLGIFALSSLLCGLAPNVYWLIGFRAVQGIGSAMLQALGAAIITEVFPAQERGRALGLIGTTVSTGIAVGPPLGGLIIGTIGWRWIFLVNVPIGLLSLWVIRRSVPNFTSKPNQRFDAPGAALLFVTLATYALGLTLGQHNGFDTGLVRGLLLTSALGLVAFIYTEMHAPQPMVDLRLFKNPLISMNLVMAFLVFIAMAGMYIMPFFLQYVRGFSTQQIGLMLMVNPIVMGIIAPIAGTLSDRFGSRGISLIGLALIVVGCLSISTLHSRITALGYILRLIPFGIGQGMFQSPNNSAVMGSVTRERLGVASGLLSLSRTLGQSTGVPLMGALFTSLMLTYGRIPAGTEINEAPALALVGAVNGTYRIAAFIILGAVLLAVIALVMDARRKAAEAAKQEM
jgi:EmrB/QacA subfamily drug resistance transporter